MKIRIYSKTRLLLFLTIIGMISLSAFWPVWAKGKTINPSTVLCIQVEEGDTLWKIARELKPAGTDIRKYIQEIKDYNNLDCVNIVIGDEIYVPMYR